MSVWGIDPWGITPWGAGSTISTIPVNLLEVNIVAVDTIELVFSQAMKNDSILKSVFSYTVTPCDSTISIPVTVKEVRPGKELGAKRVYLITTPPTLGQGYLVTVPGAVLSLGKLSLTTNSKTLVTRRTKVDSLCSTRPSIYDLRPQAIYRTILNAIGLEDDRIGGNQDEGEDTIRCP